MFTSMNGMSISHVHERLLNPTDLSSKSLRVPQAPEWRIRGQHVQTLVIHSTPILRAPGPELGVGDTQITLGGPQARGKANKNTLGISAFLDGR